MAEAVEAAVRAAAGSWARREARWSVRETCVGTADQLAKALGIAPLTARVLASRGFLTAEQALSFLNPRLDLLHDPLLMRGMSEAAERLLGAVRGRERILLYGDYDVDGTAAVVVLKKALELLGAEVDFHIPDRLKEGYGMRSEVIDRAVQSGVRLVVSVDTGIRALGVVKHARSLGLDVIVTDHHLPDAELPAAHAVLNPKQPGCGYPEKELCGAGIALKLVQALLRESGLPEGRQAALLDSFLKPVAIATIADIVPLTGENRVIVKRGLSGLREVRNEGLRALLQVAGFDAGESPSAQEVAFRLAPRINAAGRMASARDVIDLFLTADADRAREIAEQLDALNRERQQVETEIVESILRQCTENVQLYDRPALVFAGDDWHVGVLGIVASRLVERFSRPVFVLSQSCEAAGAGEECLSGSGRSIPAFHLLEALESMPELFTRFGGHRQAAGLTLHAARVEDFRKRFGEFAATKLTEDDLRPQHVADTHASFAELTAGCIRELLALGPFGFGNPCPIFYAAGAEIAGPAKALSKGKHFNVPVRHGGRMLICKAWNFADRAALFDMGNKVDVLFAIDNDPGSRKRGYGSWCIELRDVRKSAA